MLKTASFSKIYICCGRTDLRKGIDGLSTIVKGQFQMDAFQEDVLFLFCGSKQDRFKPLCWEGDGFVLMYKSVSCKFFLEKVAGIFGECCISVLEKVATPWSGRCHPMEADILC